MRAFSRAGEEILVVEPSMTSFAELVTMAERRAHVLEMAPPFALTADDVLAATSPATRVIFLCSPNNTTSRMLEPGDVQRIAHGAPDAVVVVDEHYIEAADDYRSRTAMTVLNSTDNVMVTRTLSKMYALAGVRVGYAAGPEAAISYLQSPATNQGSVHQTVVDVNLTGDLGKYGVQSPLARTASSFAGSFNQRIRCRPNRGNTRSAAQIGVVPCMSVLPF